MEQKDQLQPLTVFLIFYFAAISDTRFKKAYEVVLST